MKTGVLPVSQTVSNTPFELLALKREPKSVTKEQLEPFGDLCILLLRLVFINGLFSEELSTCSGLFAQRRMGREPGCSAQTLIPASIEQTSLARYLITERDPFARSIRLLLKMVFTCMFQPDVVVETANLCTVRHRSGRLRHP